MSKFDELNKQHHEHTMKIMWFKTLLEKLSNVLTEREKLVIYMRFGVREYRYPRHLGEIASDLGVTRERVRHIERKALEKIRQNKRIEWKRYEHIIEELQVASS